MTELPEPPVPAGSDLRGLPYTPIYRTRLFGSRFHARSNDAEWRAGVTLWLKSWDQVPAGSLPDDDVDLCRLAEFGKDLKKWMKVKAGALHGWFKASDGLLYHPVISECVIDAVARFAKFSKRGTKGAEARWNKHPKKMPKASTENATGIENDAHANAQAMLKNGNRIEGNRIELESPSGISPPKRRPPKTTQVPADWQPNADGIAYAKARGLTPEDVAHFRDHYRSQGKPMANWDLTWMNWCRNAVKFGNGKMPPPKRPDEPSRMEGGLFS